VPGSHRAWYPRNTHQVHTNTATYANMVYGVTGDVMPLSLETRVRPQRHAPYEQDGVLTWVTNTKQNIHLPEQDFRFKPINWNAQPGMVWNIFGERREPCQNIK